MTDPGVKVLFCGEEFPAVAGRQLTIGRSGDVEIDDNPFLHRRFLTILEEGGPWWLSNVGSTLTATVADDTGLFQAWIAPGARIPLALNRIQVWFTAGPTTYDFEVIVDNPAKVYDLADLPPAGRDDQLVFGMADDPDHQAQPVVAFNPDKEATSRSLAPAVRARACSCAPSR